MKTVPHIVIVGASSDLAKAVAKELNVRGIFVSGLSRQNDLGTGYAQARVVDYDQADWLKSFLQLEADAGIPITAILHMPGYVVFGKTLSVSREDAAKMFSINYWLLTEVARGAQCLWDTPGRNGCFWAMLSLSALRAIPDEAWYCASKAAAMRWLETMDLECRGKGSRYRYFCPGKFQSKFRSGAGTKDINQGMPLSDLAQKIADAIIKNRSHRVIGWRENIIALADRVSPGIYNRLVLRRRITSQ